MGHIWWQRTQPTSQLLKLNNKYALEMKKEVHCSRRWPEDTAPPLTYHTGHQMHAVFRHVHCCVTPTVFTTTSIRYLQLQGVVPQISECFNWRCELHFSTAHSNAYVITYTFFKKKTLFKICHSLPQFILHQGWCLRHACPIWHVAFIFYPSLTFYSILSKQEAVADHLLSHFLRYRIPRGRLY
jgi:hypothetical protein